MVLKDELSLSNELALVKDALQGTRHIGSPLVWRTMTLACGIPGLDLPPRVGGKGWSAKRMAGIFALCGKIDLDLRDVPGGGHSRLLLETKRRDYDHILLDVVRGKEFVAVAITEDGAGSDMHGMISTSIPTIDGYLISGRKVYISRLDEATRVIIFTRTKRTGSEDRLTAFILPIDMPGLVTEREEGMGLKGVSWGSLRFENVLVPLSMRVGGEGQGFSLFTRHFTYWRTAMAAAAIGCARGAIEQAIEWLGTRNAFGGPIGRFSHLQQQLAQHIAYLHMAWLLVISVMDRIDSGLPSFTDAAMVKAEAVEIAVSAVDWVMKIYGAKGYSTRTDIEKRLRDLMGLRIADGTSDVLRGQVARAMLGEELYELSLGRSNTKDNVGSSFRRFW